MMRFRLHHHYQKIALLITILISSFYIFRSLSYPIHDFANSYFPALFFTKQELTIEVFDPFLFNKKIADSGITDVFASFNPNPPSVAFLFAPLTIFKPGTAKLIFTVGSLIFFLLSFYRFMRQSTFQNSWMLVLLPVVFFVPLRNNILFGQSYLLVTALLIEGFLAYSAKRNVLSSFCWTIAIFMKVFPVCVLLFLLLKREFKMSLILAGSCALLLLTCVLFQGLEIWDVYLREILPRAGSGDLHSAYTTSTQSISMLLKFLFVPDEVFNTNPLWPNQAVYIIASSIISGLILSYGVNFIQKKSNERNSFTFLICCTQLLSPQGSSYSILLLCLLLPMLLAQYTFQQRMAMLTLVLLLGSLPTSYFQMLPLPFNFLKLILFVLLILWLIYSNKISFSVTWFLSFSLLISVVPIVKLLNETDTSIRLVDREWNSLMVDYSVQSNKLCYSYWTDQGVKSECTNIDVQPLADKSISIENNQIYYNGVVLTQSADNKKKPLMVSDNEIVYLSDRGKGYKFYAIRKIKVP